MSSLVRRIQRQVMPSQAIFPAKRVNPVTGKVTIVWTANPARKKFWQGRGDKLGVKNPKDKALLARTARETKRAHRKAFPDG